MGRRGGVMVWKRLRGRRKLRSVQLIAGSERWRDGRGGGEIQPVGSTKIEYSVSRASLTIGLSETNCGS